MRDFNKYAYYGFIMSFFVVPPALAPKEEAIGQVVDDECALSTALIRSIYSPGRH